MGFSGKMNERQEAINLRKQGVSVRAIQEKLGVSRSSVSLWTRAVELTPEQKRKLYLNIHTGQLKGSIIAAENKKRRRQQEEVDLEAVGRNQLGGVSKRDRFVAGISLYFAEGDKRGGTVGFTNSDPRAIKFMMEWCREFMVVPERKYRGYLYIHDNLDREAACSFWSELTQIPRHQFTKTYIVANNKNRLRKVIHQYGVFRISFSDVRAFRRLKGWISGLLGDMISQINNPE